jgi:hypothetical protein
MAYAPSNTSVIYAATATQIFKTINGGTSWTLMATSLTRITYISVDPTNSQRLWITKSAYTATDKVWYSPDGGTTWNNFSGTLPNIPVNCIVYQNSTADGLYIGTDVGVYYRNASMADWIFYNTGLPNVIVNDLEISYINNKLWAGTFGRGLWNSDLYCPTLPQPSSISGLNSMCSGNGATSYSIAVVAGATSYSWTLPIGWSGTSSTNLISGSPGNSGNITVAASNSCGLSPTQSFFVTINPLPSVNATSSSNLICVGQTATLSATGANNYTWNPGGNGSSIVISPTSNTTYTLTGVDGNGCSNNFIYTQNVTTCTSLNQLTNLSEQIFIYPNPFNNKFILSFKSGVCLNCSVSVFNALGSLIYKQNIMSEITEINLNAYGSGIYFVKVTDGASTFTNKIIKE